MNKRQIETFVTLAKSLNYARTARILYLSQPGVTQQIKKLEEEIGVKLFDRTRKKVELTAAGRQFSEDCQEILSRLNNAISRAQSHAHQFQSSLRVGYSGNAMKKINLILRKYHQSMPDVHVYVSIGDPLTTMAMFERGELDVIYNAHSGASDVNEAVSYRELFVSRFICVLPPGHRLKDHEEIFVDDLASEELIFLERKNCPPEMAYVQETIKERIPESIVYYSGSADVSTMMIEAGFGIAVMPEFAYRNEGKLPYRPVGGFPSISYGIFWKKADKSDKIRKLVECSAEIYGHNET